MSGTVRRFLHLNIGCTLVIISFLWLQDSSVSWWPAVGWSQGFSFSPSHHVEPGSGANPVSLPIIFFPWRWSCHNVKLTPHFYPLRRRFLHWFSCTIKNISHIVLTAFIITTSQKLCKVMLHTTVLGLMMVFTKTTVCINFGRTEFLTNCTPLTNFWNISTT